MSGNYVRKLGQEVFKNAGLLNLQRIFMNNCHVQVSIIVGPSFVIYTILAFIIPWRIFGSKNDSKIKIDLNTISA